MLMIRLQRVGRKNHAEFRMVVTEKTRGPKANYLEKVGHYNPHTDVVDIDGERVQHWISKGAQVSDTVHNLLVSNKIIKGEKKNVLPKKSPIVKEAKETEESASEEAQETPEAEEKKEEETPEETPEEKKETDKPAEAEASEEKDTTKEKAEEK